MAFLNFSGSKGTKSGVGHVSDGVTSMLVDDSTASMMLLLVDEEVFGAAAVLIMVVEGSWPWDLESGTGDPFHHPLLSRRRLVVTSESLAASSSSEKTCFFFLFRPDELWVLDLRFPLPLLVGYIEVMSGNASDEDSQLKM